MTRFSMKAIPATVLLTSALALSMGAQAQVSYSVGDGYRAGMPAATIGASGSSQAAVNAYNNTVPGPNNGNMQESTPIVNPAGSTSNYVQVPYGSTVILERGAVVTTQPTYYPYTVGGTTYYSPNNYRYSRRVPQNTAESDSAASATVGVYRPYGPGTY